MNLSVVRPCTLAEYRHRRTVTPLRGVDAYASEEQQKQRWLEARERLNPKPPKPIRVQPLLAPPPPVITEPVIETPPTSDVRIVPTTAKQRNKALLTILKICEKRGIPVVETRSGKRSTYPVSHCRHECFYYLRKDTDLSLGQIGMLFGGLHHTTVLSGIQLHATRAGLPEVRKDGDRSLKPNVINRAIQMRLEGHKLQTISDDIGIGIGSVHGILERYYWRKKRESSFPH